MAGAKEEKEKVEVPCDAGSVFCKMLLSAPLSLLVSILALMNLQAFSWFIKGIKGGKKWRMHKTGARTFTFSRHFSAADIKSHHSPQHSFKMELPIPSSPLFLFDSRENPTNVFNVLWCIIYQTGCWYGKRTSGDKENQEWKKGS